MEVHYNLPTSRGEICKFDLKTTVKEIKDNAGGLFGPVKKVAKGTKKKRVNRRKKCKGKNKKRCRDKGKKSKSKKKPAPTRSPVKSIQVKVCTR